MSEKSEVDARIQGTGIARGEPANRTLRPTRWRTQQKSEDRMRMSIGSRLRVASVLAATCLLFRPTTAAADPNQCQRECLIELVNFVVECTGIGLSCVTIPQICERCVAQGTTLVYDLPEPGRVSLTVYDVRGRRVATIADAHQSAGRHSVEWNGADRDGRALPSGVYLIRMEAGGNAAVVHVGVIR